MKIKREDLDKLAAVARKENAERQRLLDAIEIVKKYLPGAEINDSLVGAIKSVYRSRIGKGIDTKQVFLALKTSDRKAAFKMKAVRTTIHALVRKGTLRVIKPGAGRRSGIFMMPRGG